jgi:hypothetical protein
MMSMLLAGIFPAKQTQQKGMECSEKKKKKKSRTHHICIPGILGTHDILQLFMARTRMFKNFISHNPNP